MKKYMVCILAIIIMVTLAISGCSDNASSTPANNPESETLAASQTIEGPTKDNPIKLIMAHWNPTTMPAPIDYDPFAYMFEAWCDAIEEETEGRVIFERYPSETLVKTADFLDAIKTGVCDVGEVHPPMTPGEFPLHAVMALPGLYPNSTVASIVAWKVFEEGYTAEEWSGVHCLWKASNNSQDIGCKTKQIETLEDWKDLKVGVFGEPETSIVKALGATPVGIPLFEQYIAMERGTVDALWIEFNGQVAFKFYEVANYLTAAHGNARTLDFCMNIDSYNSLPPDIKEVFDRNSGMSWTVMTGKRFDDNVARSVGFLEDYQKERGNPPIYYPPDDEVERWMEVWEPVRENVVSDLEAQGMPAQALLTRIEELVEKYTDYRLGGFENYTMRSLSTAGMD